MKTLTLTEFRPIQLSLLLACGIATGGRAQVLLTDQSLQPPPNTGGSYHYDAVLSSLVPATGQEFTPSLQGLDFVEIRLQDPRVTDTGTFAIAIHEGNIAAPVLGLSGLVSKSGGFGESNTHFSFPSTVQLVPGNIYVMEITQLAGDSRWTIEIP